MFFKVLAAIVTADAFNRHMREQQHRAWAAATATRDGGIAATPRQQPGTQSGEQPRWDIQRPERPI